MLDSPLQYCTLYLVQVMSSHGNLQAFRQTQSFEAQIRGEVVCSFEFYLPPETRNRVDRLGIQDVDSAHGAAAAAPLDVRVAC